MRILSPSMARALDVNINRQQANTQLATNLEGVLVIVFISIIIDCEHLLTRATPRIVLEGQH